MTAPEHRITWSPNHADLAAPRVSNRVADLGAVFVNVGEAGQYLIRNAAAARAMAAAFTQAADLLDQAAAATVPPGPMCAAVRHSDDPWMCTLDAGHEGDHEAQTAGDPVHWPQDATGEGESE